MLGNAMKRSSGGRDSFIGFDFHRCRAFERFAVSIYIVGGREWSNTQHTSITMWKKFPCLQISPTCLIVYEMEHNKMTIDKFLPIMLYELFWSIRLVYQHSHDLI